ncbi:MAG: hypothetical protein EOO89_20150, partial [Pedobacter sp.]
INEMISIWKNNPMYNPQIFRSEVVTSSEKKYLLSRMSPNITYEQMDYMDKTFSFSSSKNTDVQLAWYLIAIRNKYAPANKWIAQYLRENGRMWHIIPLYKELLKTPEGKKRAEEIYKLARPNYHPMTYTALDKILK